MPVEGGRLVVRAVEEALVLRRARWVHVAVAGLQCIRLRILHSLYQRGVARAVQQQFLPMDEDGRPGISEIGSGWPGSWIER